MSRSHPLLDIDEQLTVLQLTQKVAVSSERGGVRQVTYTLSTG